MPSSQQLKIAKLCADQNVVVSARPGSGKTATIEAIAAAHPDKQIGSILFSKRLQSETSSRLKKYHNSHVFTFHAMAGKLLNRVVPSDRELIRLLRKVDRDGKLPVWSSTPFDIIVLDEFQDCNPETFWLVACFLRSNNIAKEGQPARIVVLGDERQSIYRFRNADPRYLTLAPELLGPMSPYPFAEVQLGKSFRLPMPTVDFINHAWLGGEQYISSSKRGPKPIVLRCNLWESPAMAERLSHLIKRYGPQNSVIIAPSIRTKGPLQGLTNMLAEVYGIPISVPTDDDAPLDDQVIHGKMCISTIHQFKGRERELVILLGMDSTYFEFLGRDQPDDTCPNEAFVALTRALSQLVVLHQDENSMMSCVSVDALYNTAEVLNMIGSETEIIPQPGPPGRPLELGLLLPLSVGVRDMTRYLQGDALDRIVKRCLHVKRVSSRLLGRERINIQNVVASDTQKGFFESVSDINGLAIAASLELETLGTLKSLDVDQKEVNKNMPIVPQQLAPWLCRHACRYEAKLSGYLPRVIQMEHHKFDWIRHQDLELARRRLGNELADPATSLDFEVEMSERFHVNDKSTTLYGRADIIASCPVENEDASDKTIWEIKFVSQLTNEHIVQACVYAYLLGSESGELPRIILYNVRDGDKREITPRHGRPSLKKLVTDVLTLRYTAGGEVSYEEFIKRCTETTQKVMGLGGSKDEE